MYRYVHGAYAYHNGPKPHSPQRGEDAAALFRKLQDPQEAKGSAGVHGDLSSHGGDQYGASLTRRLMVCRHGKISGYSGQQTMIIHRGRLIYTGIYWS